jgi:hypothetical protein
MTITTDAPPTTPKRGRGQPPLLTENMLEDVEFMARTGEGATAAARRLSDHSEANRSVTRAQLLAALRNRGLPLVAFRLIENEPLSDVALSNSEAAARSRALADARAARRRKAGA